MNGTRSSSPENSSRTSSESNERPLLADRIFGVVGGSMVLGALVILLTGGFGGDEGIQGSDPQVLELIAPAAADSVHGALELVFQTQAELEPQPGGWGAGGLHVHAEINGREIMPGVNDIRPGPNRTYSWTLTAPPAGETTVRLRWSDLEHRPIEEGASQLVRVHVR